MLAFVQPAENRAAPGTASVVAAPPRPAGAAIGHALARRLHVLVVDDSPVNRAVVQQFLSATAETVDQARDGREGLQLFQSGSYDLVLMDWHMPELDGLSATRLLRAWEREHRRAATPVFALTASSEPTAQAECLAAGCTGFLAKPVRQADLLGVLGMALAAGSAPASAAAAGGGNRSAPGEPAQSACPRVRVDPELAPLVPAFLEEMRELAGRLRDALERQDYEELRGCAHQAVGPGGSYGFGRLSELARALEEASTAHRAGEARQRLAEIDSYLEQVEVVYE